MRILQTTRVVPIALVVVATVAGCGRTDGPSTPVACLEGAIVYVRALNEAPDTVKLQGVTPISDCLAENQEAGDLATVGTAALKTVTELNAEARAEPGGAANLQLGYLLGAAQRGADRTEGIHSDLIRRLTVAARYTPEGPLPAGFLGTYAEGFDAGLKTG